MHFFFKKSPLNYFDYKSFGLLANITTQKYCVPVQLKTLRDMALIDEGEISDVIKIDTYILVIYLWSKFKSV